MRNGVPVHCHVLGSAFASSYALRLLASTQGTLSCIEPGNSHESLVVRTFAHHDGSGSSDRSYFLRVPVSPSWSRTRSGYQRPESARSGCTSWVGRAGIFPRSLCSSPWRSLACAFFQPDQCLNPDTSRQRDGRHCPDLCPGKFSQANPVTCTADSTKVYSESIRRISKLDVSTCSTFRLLRD